MRRLISAGIVLVFLAACQPGPTLTPAPAGVASGVPSPTPTVVDDATQLREFIQFYWDTYWTLISDPKSPLELTYKITILEELTELRREIKKKREDKLVYAGRLTYRSLKIGDVHMKNGYPTSIVTFCTDNSELTGTVDGQSLRFPKLPLLETVTVVKIPDGSWRVRLLRNKKSPC